MPLCPACHIPLVTERDEVPWCGRCEHHLAHFELDKHEPLPWRWFSLQSQRLGFASDAKLGAAMAGDPHRATAGLWALRLISVLMYAFGVALAATGVWYLGWSAKPPVGLVLLALSLLFLPKFGRVGPMTEYAYVTNAASRPAFFSLLSRVAATAGTGMPDVVAFSRDWNASAAIVGLRRRKVLIVGIPYWAALQPQERVALLAHELGHLANEDSARSLITQPALTQFGRVGRVFRKLNDLGDNSLYTLPWRVVMGSLGGIFWSVHLALNILGSSESRRTELRADMLAAKLAGTRATISGLDVAVCREDMLPHISVYTADGDVLRSWNEGVQWARNNLADRMKRLRQLSNRDRASLLASHPAPGRRQEFLTRLPYQDPAVVLTEAESIRIDRELNPYAVKFRAEAHDLVHGI